VALFIFKRIVVVGTLGLTLSLAAGCSAPSVHSTMLPIAGAQPHVVALSERTSERSGRVLIHGVGFGDRRGRAHVEIGGVRAPVTRWSDTLIAAYVPSSAPLGRATLRVFTRGGAQSNAAQLAVAPAFRNAVRIAGANGNRVQWRFKADADYIQNRPAVGPDGTIYAIDVQGHLYALSPTGSLKWVFNASGTGFGNVSVGTDGTVYTGSTSSIFALAPDGTLKWTFAQNPSAFILLGPNVGPDGNIYAVATQGMGVFSLAPQGTLRWMTTENYDRPIVGLQEVVFAPGLRSRLYFHANRHVRGLGLDGRQLFTLADGLSTLQGDPQPAVGRDGSLYTNLFSAPDDPSLGRLNEEGNLRWRTLNQSNVLTTPEVGPDGVIYDARNLSTLYALNPDATVRWQYTDSGILLSHMPSPRNRRLLVGGIVTYGQPVFFEAVSTSGHALWKLILPVENGLNIVPMSRARFASDGTTAYIGTSIAGQSSNSYCYLYSVRT